MIETENKSLDHRKHVGFHGWQKECVDSVPAREASPEAEAEEAAPAPGSSQRSPSEKRDPEAPGTSIIYKQGLPCKLVCLKKISKPNGFRSTSGD